MKEMLKIYSYQGEYVGEMEKSEAHNVMKQQFSQTGKVQIKHRDVKLILINSKGRIILQRRSKWKGDNAGMWDKTIGGHVSADDSYDLAMLKECAEELGIPATVVDVKEFESAIKSTDLNVVAVLSKLSYLDNFQSSRKAQGGANWVEPSMTQFYIGFYDGAIRFIDSESSGIQVFSKEELKQEIDENPELFTEDVKYVLEKFIGRINPITDKLKHVLSD
jgi:isopentenyldiphosphate isomerase